MGLKKRNIAVEYNTPYPMRTLDRFWRWNLGVRFLKGWAPVFEAGSRPIPPEKTRGIRYHTRAE